MMPDRAVVKKAIQDAGGNLSRAAGRLGCSRPTLYQWIYRLGLDRVAGVCQDRRAELDERERKHTQARHGEKTIPERSVDKPHQLDKPTLPPVQQVAAVEIPITATVKVPETLWKRVRKGAIDRDCTVSEFVRVALERALEQEQLKAKR
jgi:hypothetical protein